ncbi:hypothetical protein M422DRAFT_275759 [Sphaerobolus stellatus SS14]|uniref:Uncharacterized protein n=1 Tax=Sphaerobolus stellatus (strain SS14) TaxID=990650 RepID=A0A0C9T416_SPHS4|nr:hypothetical protein M422DRAFT_275759 [Sphaerobolus stellatus SS14]
MTAVVTVGTMIWWKTLEERRTLARRSTNPVRTLYLISRTSSSAVDGTSPTKPGIL